MAAAGDVGGAGLIELQAGPRCRLVLEAFRRLGLPDEAGTFYGLGERMVRGAARRWALPLAA